MKRQLLLYSALVGLDQGLKWWFSAHRPESLVINQGMILGFGGVGLYSWVILIIIWLATIYYWSKAAHDLPRQWGIGLIAAGGFSNLVDRPLTGGVKDYIFFPYLNLYANIADLAVTTGVIIIVVIEIKRHLKW